MYSMVSSSCSSADMALMGMTMQASRFRQIRRTCPRSASPPIENASQHAANGDGVGRDVSFLEHAGHAFDAARTAPGAPDQQIDEPWPLVGAIGLLVEREPRLEREHACRVVGAHGGVVVARQDGLGRMHGGFHRLANALA